MKEVTERFIANPDFTKEEFKELLKCAEDPEDAAYLAKEAARIRKERYGDKVYTRGLIEFTNYCKNNCYYCGIRRGNLHASRYRLTKEEILDCCADGYELGFRTFVLQGGEDAWFTDERMTDIIRTIRESYQDCAITLSIGEKSYENMIASINESRNTTFVRFVVAMDIPLIGRTASRILDGHFHGSLRELELAALDRFDFACLEGIGDTMSGNIHEWFRNSDHLLLWRNLQKELNFENGMDAEASGEENNMNGTNNNKFAGCTIVATGKLENFTRDGINVRIISLGATPGSSVTKKTDYLICGEKAGSKLAKAQQLGVKILTEQEFLEMTAS